MRNDREMTANTDKRQPQVTVEMKKTLAVVWPWRSGSSGPCQASGDPPGSCLPCTTFIAANRGRCKRSSSGEMGFSRQASPGRWSKVFPFTIRSSFDRDRIQRYIAAWKDTLQAIAKAGVEVICYNFMPVVDWTRTDLKWRLPTSGYALRFDAVDFAVYDLFILARKGLIGDYSDDRVRAAHTRFDSMPEAAQIIWNKPTMAGLPGAEASYNREDHTRFDR